MKRRDLVRKWEEIGWVLVRHGASHDSYTNPKTRKSQPVPRHGEFQEGLAKSFIKKLSEG